MPLKKETKHKTILSLLLLKYFLFVEFTLNLWFTDKSTCLNIVIGLLEKEVYSYWTLYTIIYASQTLSFVWLILSKLKYIKVGFISFTTYRHFMGHSMPKFDSFVNI